MNATMAPIQQIAHLGLVYSTIVKGNHENIFTGQMQDDIPALITITPPQVKQFYSPLQEELVKSIVLLDVTLDLYSPSVSKTILMKELHQTLELLVDNHLD